MYVNLFDFIEYTKLSSFYLFCNEAIVLHLAATTLFFLHLKYQKYNLLSNKQ